MCNLRGCRGTCPQARVVHVNAVGDYADGASEGRRQQASITRIAVRQRGTAIEHVRHGRCSCGDCRLRPFERRVAVAQRHWHTPCPQVLQEAVALVDFAAQCNDRNGVGTDPSVNFLKRAANTSAASQSALEHGRAVGAGTCWPRARAAAAGGARPPSTAIERDLLSADR